jgi:hypothetical protein
LKGLFVQMHEISRHVVKQFLISCLLQLISLKLLTVFLAFKCIIRDGLVLITFAVYVYAWVENGFEETMGKQLVSFITCGCESSTPFFLRPSRDGPYYVTGYSRRVGVRASIQVSAQ